VASVAITIFLPVAWSLEHDARIPEKTTAAESTNRTTLFIMITLPVGLF
jgi:hypothetical protein